MQLPRFESLDIATQVLMVGDMPPAFLPIIEVIGFKHALALVDGLAGQVFVMPKQPHAAGRARFAAVEGVIGIDAALQMAKYFGGEKLAIPRLEIVKRRLRNRDLIRDFDAMTKTTSASQAVNALATQYELTSRQVEIIVGGYGEGGEALYKRMSRNRVKNKKPKAKAPAAYGRTALITAAFSAQSQD